MNVAYLKVMHGLRFHLFVFLFLVPAKNMMSYFGKLYWKCNFYFFDASPIRLHGEGGVYDLYCSQPPGGDQRARSFTFQDVRVTPDSAANMRCEQSRAWMREWRVTFFFFATGTVPSPGVGALRKLRTLRIGSGGTAYLSC